MSLRDARRLLSLGLLRHWFLRLSFVHHIATAQEPPFFDSPSGCTLAIQSPRAGATYPYSLLSSPDLGTLNRVAKEKGQRGSVVPSPPHRPSNTATALPTTTTWLASPPSIPVAVEVRLSAGPVAD
eukprot:CAMPEP_0171967780 /NCGR_PEP_ID=MMETSP0993-20121228/199745_1 /TAXON_ID=483369 /ORGANISM="non described non described, Strain CCMP2098" /LENGTH=125 /DNA_ID=CAMNT_0012617355 /DNA_START=102 /DNA_END=476 /DNA_ORIENTATION=-